MVNLAAELNAPATPDEFLVDIGRHVASALTPADRKLFLLLVGSLTGEIPLYGKKEEATSKEEVLGIRPAATAREADERIHELQLRVASFKGIEDGFSELAVLLEVPIALALLNPASVVDKVKARLSEPTSPPAAHEDPSPEQPKERNDGRKAIGETRDVKCLRLWNKHHSVALIQVSWGPVDRPTAGEIRASLRGQGIEVPEPRSRQCRTKAEASETSTKEPPASPEISVSPEPSALQTAAVAEPAAAPAEVTAKPEVPVPAAPADIEYRGDAELKFGTLVEKIEHVLGEVPPIDPEWRIEPSVFIQALGVVCQGGLPATLAANFPWGREFEGIHAACIVHRDRLATLNREEQQEYKRQLLKAITPAKAGRR